MTCASVSPIANPTKEVKLFTNTGLSFSIFEYAFQNLHSYSSLARIERPPWLSLLIASLMNCSRLSSPHVHASDESKMMDCTEGILLSYRRLL
jgi:hypothetical protein